MYQNPWIWDTPTENTPTPGKTPQAPDRALEFSIPFGNAKKMERGNMSMISVS